MSAATRIAALALWLALAPAILAADLDVFLIAGQSNGYGNGNAAQSVGVDAAHVLQYWSGAITPANDPVGNAAAGIGAMVGGSAWPSFGQTYYSVTGRAVLLVPGPAVGGTGQCASADMGTGFSDVGNGNWDANGPLVSASLTSLQSALAAAQATGWTTYFRGVLWVQGENDGLAINAGTQTGADYRGCLSRTIARYQAAYPGSGFFIFRTGTILTTPDAGFAAVRQAQEDVAAPQITLSSPAQTTRVVFRGALSFSVTGMMADTAHYTQAGYNLMGRSGALSVVQFLQGE